jgi:hypothetical protein
MESDIALNRLESLLHAMAKLYTDMFSSLMHERTAAYHAASDDAEDIGVALHAYIKQIKHHATLPHALAVEPIPATDTLANHTNPEANTSPMAHVQNPLAEYFKKNNASAELATPIGEKLKLSAWDHTQSTIRFAHQGDYANAKLHADLANNAIHELSHFMNAADFSAFKRAVKAELFDKT